jgi:hypothetical protein
LLTPWFGTDDKRTTTRDTFRAISEYVLNYEGVDQDNAATTFCERDYPTIIAEWIVTPLAGRRRLMKYVVFNHLRRVPYRTDVLDVTPSKESSN